MKDSLDVWGECGLCNGQTVQKLVLLLVIADDKLKVAGDDLLIVFPGSFGGQLEDLCGQVLYDGRQIDACSASGRLGVVPSIQKTPLK